MAEREPKRHKITVISSEGEKEYWSETPIPEIVEEQNRYEDCTEEELRVLLRHAERLEEDDGIALAETIIKIESALKKIDALEDKVDSGIIFEG